VKLGMMLSGGFDSNLIFNYLNSTGNLNNEFIAFNAGLGSENESESTLDKALYSERTIAEKMAHEYKVKLKKIEVSPEKFIKIKEFIDIIEEPICNPSGFLINEICGKAKDTSNKVLFSGHGGDEIFGGYRRHMAAKFNGSLKGLRWLANLIPKKLIKPNDLYRIISSMKSKYQFFKLSAIGIQSLDDGLINPDNIITNRDLDEMAKVFEKPIKGSSLSTLKKMMVLEFKGYLSAQNLINMDKFSMANSIEVRVPFLNLEIIKRGFQFADNELVKMKTNKIPLRNLARKKLPKEIFKLKKSGFGPSLKSLLHSPESIELLTGDITKSRGIINTENTLKKINNNKISQSEIMQLMNFAFIERWFRTYID
jgi:asparagine synthase (glutamine-hydrolysing)